MGGNIQDEKMRVVMEKKLVEFKTIWKRIIETKVYDKSIEELAYLLPKFKKMGYWDPKEEKFFEYAEIYSDFMRVADKERNVKEALGKVSEA